MHSFVEIYFMEMTVIVVVRYFLFHYVVDMLCK